MNKPPPETTELLAAHPEPPVELHDQSLPHMTTRGPFYRIHRRDLAPLYFGRQAAYRFDAPERQFGVLYVAFEVAGAFIETLGWSTGVRMVDRATLQGRAVARVDSDRPLNLVDLTGQGLAQLGVDNRLCDGDYRLAQRWSAALHAHPAKPDGIAYRCRHDPEQRVVALFDRCAPSLRITDCGSLWDDIPPRTRLAVLLDRYEFGLIDD